MHTHTHARTLQVGLLSTSDQPLAKAATCTTHTRQTSMTSAGFDPTIPAIKRLQTYALQQRDPHSSLLRHSIFTQAQYTNGFLGGVFRLIISHTLSLFCRDILYLKIVASHFLTARLTCRTLKYNEQRVAEVRHMSASPRETFTITSLNTVVTNLLARINCNTSK
jgi:hypothetical protein